MASLLNLDKICWRTARGNRSTVFPILCGNRHHRLTAVAISPRVFLLCSLRRRRYGSAFSPVTRRSISQYRQVMRMSDPGAANVFVRLRWPATDGKPVCPDCGCTVCYDCRRGAHRRWRCQACGGDFSVTSRMLFAWHKLPLKVGFRNIRVHPHDRPAEFYLHTPRLCRTRLRRRLALHLFRAESGGASPSEKLRRRDIERSRQRRRRDIRAGLQRRGDRSILEVLRPTSAFSQYPRPVFVSPSAPSFAARDQCHPTHAVSIGIQN